MTKVTISREILATAQAAAVEWDKQHVDTHDELYRLKFILEAAIPAYLGSEEPGHWEYGVQYRSLIGGEFNRTEWSKTREDAEENFKMLSHPRGQFRDRGDGHGIAVRPCRRWIGNPRSGDSFEEFDDDDAQPEIKFYLIGANPDQAEEIFDKAADVVYENGDAMGVDVIGAGLFNPPHKDHSNCSCQETHDEVLPQEAAPVDQPDPVRGTGSSPDACGCMSSPPMTVSKVLDALFEMGRDATVPGLDLAVGSYRGYYERLAISPGPGVNAGELFDLIARRQGSYMTGYKGGEFEIHGDTLVHVADWGETGPKLVGFDGFTPVLEEEGW